MATLAFVFLRARLQQRDGRALRRLRVQCDNAAGECKNKFFVAFLALLLWLGWVTDEIELCMLPQGHTHSQVDQLFSTFFRSLRHGTPIRDLEDVTRAVGKHFTTSPALVLIEQVYNWQQVADVSSAVVLP